MKRFLKICAICVICGCFAGSAFAQNTLVTNTFKTPEGKTPAQANLKSSATIGATPIYGKAYFRATDVAGNVVREFELGGVTYAGEVLGFIKSDGTLISYAETAGVVLIPLTSALPSGLAYCLELQWNGSTDGRVAPTTLKGKTLCKNVPDQATAVWANLATASLTSPSYGYQTGLAGAVLSPENWTCVTAASVPTPAAGFVNLFCDSSNGNKYSRKNSDGSVTVIEGGTVPTGTGVRKVVAGVEDAAASLIVNADVSATAAIADSKLATISTTDKVSPGAINDGGVAATQALFSGAAGAAAFRAIADADVPDTISLTNITQITNRAITDLSGQIAIGQTQLTTRGDLWSVNSLGSLYRLAIGTNDQVLATNGLDPVWAAITDAMVPNTITIDQATLALTGDSATAFFSAGQIEAARGGTGIDSSASTGVLRVNAGTWTADAGISHLTASTSASLRNVLNDEFGTTGVSVFFDTTGAATNDVFCVTGASTAGVCTSSTPVNNQTGVSYTFVTGDRGKLVTISNAGAVAVTLPQAGASFPSGWFTDAQNRGAGTVTITPTTSTIDGAASLTLKTDDGVMIVSDGTNYFTQRGRLRTIADADVPDTITASNYVPLTRTLTGGTGIAVIGDLSADRTIAIDTTEIATATFGSGADLTWTFDVTGATDPSFLFTGTSIDVGSVAAFRAASFRNVNAAALQVAGRAPDGATAIGVKLDNTVTLATAGAKLVSFQNNTVEKSYIDKDGGFSGNAATATALAADPAGCTNQFVRDIAAAGTLTCATVSKADAAATFVHTDQGNTYSTGAQDFGSATSFVVPKAAGAAPTADGDVRYDTTRESLVGGGNGAVKGFYPRVLYATNCTTEANCTGTNQVNADSAAQGTTETNFASNWSMPASWLGINKILMVCADIELTTSATAPTGTLRFKLDSTVIAATGAIGVGNSQTARTYRMCAQIQGTVAPGVSVSVQVGGWQPLGMGTVSVTPNTVDQPAAAGDLTAARVVQLSWQWGTATTGNTAQLNQLVFLEMY